MTIRLKIMLLALMLMSASAIPSLSFAEPLKIAFLYGSPLGDHGWYAQADIARKAIEEKYGDKVKAIMADNVREGADGERVIRKLINDDVKYFYLGSSGYREAATKLAAEYPDVKFTVVSGYTLTGNLGGVQPEFFEGAYIAGIAAGMITKTNTLGFVGAVPIPDVILQANAYLLGARTVNPKAVVKVTWINEWYNPGKERDATVAIIAQGADVVYSGEQDAPAVIQAAEEKGVYSFGMFSDVRKFAPTKLVSSVLVDWNSTLGDEVGSILDGTYKPKVFYGGFKEGVVKMLDWNTTALSADQIALLKQKEQAVADGSLQIFAGPIRKQDGTVVIPEGAVMPEADVRVMNYLVEGTDGTVPNQ